MFQYPKTGFAIFDSFHNLLRNQINSRIVSSSDSRTSRTSFCFPSFWQIHNYVTTVTTHCRNFEHGIHAIRALKFLKAVTHLELLNVQENAITANRKKKCCLDYHFHCLHSNLILVKIELEMDFLFRRCIRVSQRIGNCTPNFQCRSVKFEQQIRCSYSISTKLALLVAKQWRRVTSVVSDLSNLIHF